MSNTAFEKNCAPLWLEPDRVETKNSHGTGNTLSSVIAALLTFENDLAKSVQQAKKYISEAILYGAEYQIGNGHGPVNHSYQNGESSF